MNTKKTLLLLGILVALVLVYFVVQWTSGGGRSKSYREELVSVDTTKISKIEIISGGKTTLITREGKAWTTEGKPAKWTSISSMVGALRSIKPTRLASRSEEKWSEFQVDSTGTQVKIYEDGEKSLDLIIGRFGVEGQRSFYTYVRLAEDKDTYVAADFMGMSVGKTSADYRNDLIMRLKQDSVVSVDFNYTDSAFTLAKSLEGVWIVGGQQVDSTRLVSFFRDLGYVTSKSFASSVGLPVVQDVTFHFTNGTDLQVSQFSDGSFASSENKAEAFFDERVVAKVFKGTGYFIP